jgi:hypothetical protein
MWGKPPKAWFAQVIHWPILLVLSFHVNERLVSVACSGSTEGVSSRRHTSRSASPCCRMPICRIGQQVAICSTQAACRRCAPRSNNGAEDPRPSCSAICGLRCCGRSYMRWPRVTAQVYQTNAPAMLPNHFDGRARCSVKDALEHSRDFERELRDGDILVAHKVDATRFYSPRTCAACAPLTTPAR